MSRTVSYYIIFTRSRNLYYRKSVKTIRPSLVTKFVKSTLEKVYKNSPRAASFGDLTSATYYGNASGSNARYPSQSTCKSLLWTLQGRALFFFQFLLLSFLDLFFPSVPA